MRENIEYLAKVKIPEDFSIFFNGSPSDADPYFKFYNHIYDILYPKAEILYGKDNAEDYTYKYICTYLPKNMTFNVTAVHVNSYVADKLRNEYLLWMKKEKKITKKEAEYHTSWMNFQYGPVVKEELDSNYAYIKKNFLVQRKK